MLKHFWTVALVAVIILAISGLFIGLGFILGQIFYFTLFEATIICLLSCLVLFGFTVTVSSLPDLYTGFDDKNDDD